MRRQIDGHLRVLPNILANDSVRQLRPVLRWAGVVFVTVDPKLQVLLAEFQLEEIAECHLAQAVRQHGFERNCPTRHTPRIVIAGVERNERATRQMGRPRVKRKSF